MKPPISIDNANGIDLFMHLSPTTITDHAGTHCGDDEILLTIDDPEEYDTDLIQGGTLLLHFTKSQARRLARRLWQMAGVMKTAEQRTMGDIENLPIVPEELAKAWQK